MYLSNLFNYDWEQTRSPAGAIQWKPKDGAGANTIPDAHVEGVSHAPMMFTTDLALKFDPTYREISKRFLDNPEEFELAFAKAWFKLTHRDMGPRALYLGAEVPEEVLVWQDPVPAVDHELIDDSGHRRTQAAPVDCGPADRRAGAYRVGVRIHLPRKRHARWCQWRAHSLGAAEGLAGQ